MAGKGRPSLYEKKVEPYLEKVTQMALSMTEEQIADTLGISHTTFAKYKNQYIELNEALKKGRAELVMELKSTLIKKARGFNYEERKIIKKDGVVVREEIYVRASTPDVGAIHLLLKNSDEDWANEPQALALKKEELELQKLKLKEW